MRICCVYDLPLAGECGDGAVETDVGESLESRSALVGRPAVVWYCGS